MMAAAGQLLGERNWVWCLDHQLDLIVEAAVRGCGATVFNNVSSIVSWFYASPARHMLLDSAQRSRGRNVLWPVKPVGTRWFSNIDMASRYLVIKDDIAEVYNDTNSGLSRSCALPSSDDIRVLETASRIFLPLLRIAKAAQSEKKPTIAKDPKWIMRMKSFVKL